MSLFCIVSWHQEGRPLCFWNGHAWGSGGKDIEFFKTRKAAMAALREVKDMGPGFMKPNVLDVDGRGVSRLTSS